MHLDQELGSTCMVSQCMSPEQIRVCSRALCCSHSPGNPSTKLSVKAKTNTLDKLLNFPFGFDFVNTKVLPSNLCLALFHTREQSPQCLLQTSWCSFSLLHLLHHLCLYLFHLHSSFSCMSCASCIFSPSCVASHCCLAFCPCITFSSASSAQ